MPSIFSSVSFHVDGDDLQYKYMYVRLCMKKWINEVEMGINSMIIYARDDDQDSTENKRC